MVELHSLLQHQIEKLFAQVYHRVQVLGPSFFLIFINDLTNNFKSNVKLFTDDTCLFSDVCDPLETANALNNGKWFLRHIQLSKLRK